MAVVSHGEFMDKVKYRLNDRRLAPRRTKLEIPGWAGRVATGSRAFTTKTAAGIKQFDHVSGGFGYMCLLQPEEIAVARLALTQVAAS
jgi:hypothetical protein